MRGKLPQTLINPTHVLTNSLTHTPTINKNIL